MSTTTMNSAIRFGSPHCCACVVVCHHIGPMQLCERHDPPSFCQPSGDVVPVRLPPTRRRRAELDRRVAGVSRRAPYPLPDRYTKGHRK